MLVPFQDMPTGLMAGVEVMGQDSIESFRKRTDPSANAKLAPPGCMLDAERIGMFCPPATFAIIPARVRWGFNGKVVEIIVWNQLPPFQW